MPKKIINLKKGGAFTPPFIIMTFFLIFTIFTFILLWISGIFKKPRSSSGNYMSETFKVSTNVEFFEPITKK